jgi:diacylglycerol O-acyltransferase
MVPVSVRENGRAGQLGNRISFVYVDLPCDEPDPGRRLRMLAMAMRRRKRGGEPEGADAMLNALGYAPRRLQHAVSRMGGQPPQLQPCGLEHPRPPLLLYVLGCELEEVYPVVPLADAHAVSIGMTTINDRAFFGVYADREMLPDADLLAADIDESVEDLITLS